MKGKQHPRNDVSLNPSTARDIHAVIDAVDPSRRRFVVGGGLGAATLALGRRADAGRPRRHASRRGRRPGPAGAAACPASASRACRPSVARRCADRVTGAAGLHAPTCWSPGATRSCRAARPSAATPARRPPSRRSSSACTTTACTSSRSRAATAARIAEHGLLCVNHEYTHEDVLHAGRPASAPATRWPRRASRRPRTACRSSRSCEVARPVAGRQARSPLRPPHHRQHRRCASPARPPATRC
ncbi:MAG: hypothetical protein MZW92_14415 [Comamonadaceae bacterium]|nr:hypothetical protein [Comamonadaceae bacterium]